MDEALRAAVPVVIAAAAALFSGVLAHFLRGSNALRRSLQHDASVVDTLGGLPQEELRIDMGSRAVRLVAVSRYPLFTGTEVVGVVVALLAIGAGLTAIFPAANLGNHSYFDTEAFVVLLVPVLMVAEPIWYFVSRGWSRRTIARLTYLRAHLDTTTVEEAALSARLATTTLHLLAQVASTGALVAGWLALTLAMEEPSTSERIMAGLTLMIVLGAALTFWALGRSPELNQMLPRLIDTMGLGAVIQAGELQKEGGRTQDPASESRPATASSNREATPSRSESNRSA